MLQYSPRVVTLHIVYTFNRLGLFVIVFWLTPILHCHPAFNLPDVSSIISSHYDTILPLI